MSCNDVAVILDSHRTARLAPAERSAIDVHLAACADCAAAWHAQTELAALRVPPLPASLLDRVLLASQRPRRAPRRVRTAVFVGSALLAGAAVAGVTLVTLTRPSSEPQQRAAGTAPEPAPVIVPPPANVERVVPDQTSRDERPTSVELVDTGLDVLPLVRHAPAYPEEALADDVEGRVQVKFDITAAGIVENVEVVESSDRRFEAAAVEAVARWRYLPRIVAGQRTGRESVRTILYFSLAGNGQSQRTATAREIAEALREIESYSAGLEVALDRLAADDLRSVELQLDEMVAVFGIERVDLWTFYGYLYTLQGHYDRAIDAYETAVAVAARSPVPTSGPFVQLANLYFARHQFDLALRTLLRPNLPGGNRVMSPAADALMQKLNALGVTEESVR